MRARAAVAAVVTATALATAACAAPARLTWPGSSVSAKDSLPPGIVPAGEGLPVGVYEPGFPAKQTGIGSFAAATGVRPRLTVYYSGWGERFWTTFAHATHASGAVPVVQLQPTGTKLASITSGHWDQYLRAYAAAVKTYGHRVILSFGHEMNGTWYSWGNRHETPEAFVAAWRHVVSVFRKAGAVNVTWLWAVTTVTPSSPWPGQWWPGSRWVNLVGIDGYYYHASDTFASVFAPTLAEIRQLTSSPVIISEVGIGPGPSRKSQIQGLFAGARANAIGAVVWFDIAQHDGLYHQDWRLEGDQAAIAAFQAAARSRLPAVSGHQGSTAN